MSGFTSAYEWGGRTVLDRDGNKVGKIEAVYLEHGSDEPRWGLVGTGLFGKKSSFVPLHGASPEGESVSVPVTKDEIKDAPKLETGDELSPDEETELYRHYGLERPESAPEPRGDRQGGTEEAHGKDPLDHDIDAEEIAEQSRILRKEVSS